MRILQETKKGTLTENDRMRPLQLIIAHALMGFLIATPAHSQWEWAGGIPLGEYSSVGSVGKWIFVNGAYSGQKMVVSSDLGESWFTTNIDPGVHGFTLLTAGQDTLLLALRGSTVFTSLDGGHLWAPSYTGLPPEGVGTLAYSRGSGTSPSGIMMAASASSGIFTSTDAGAHWVPSDSGLTTVNATSVISIDSIFLVGTSDRGIFRSENNGVTWSSTLNGLNDTNINTLATVAGIGFAASARRVYRTVDLGLTWQLIPQVAPDSVQSFVLVPISGQMDSMAIYVVTTSGFFRLASDDSAWVAVNHPQSNLPGGLLTFAAAEANLYMSTEYSIYRSTDLGSTWFPVGAFVSGGEVLTGHLSSKYNHPRLYMGDCFSTNRGLGWWGMRQHLDGSSVSVTTVCRDTSALGYDQIAVGTDSGRVELSNDGGQTWRVIPRPGKWSSGYKPVAVAAMDGFVFAALELSAYSLQSGDSVAGVYRTSDNGATWQKMNTAGLTDSLVLSLDVFHAKYGGRVLFAGCWRHLFRSTNDGESWTEDTVSPVHTGRKFIREVDGALYLCTQGTISSEYLLDGSNVSTFDSARVYQSTDVGETWKDVTGNLNCQFVRGFAAVSRPQYPSRVFLAACSDHAVLTSSEGGNQWEDFTSGLPYFTFGGPVGADEQFVYVALFGIQRRTWDDAIISTTEGAHAGLPREFVLCQNYPNPFNPTTTIAYDLPKASQIRLEIINALGQKVHTLVDGEQAAGRYQVVFDGKNLASGVYFCRMRTGDFVDTKKILLTK